MSRSPRSTALSHPRPNAKRQKKPQKWVIQIDTRNRPAIQVTLQQLDTYAELLEGEDEPRPKHMHVVGLARSLLRGLLQYNPREIVLDPDDFVRRSVLVYLDDHCWALLAKWETEMQFRYQAMPYPHVGDADGRADFF